MTDNSKSGVFPYIRETKKYKNFFIANTYIWLVKDWREKILKSYLLFISWNNVCIKKSFGPFQLTSVKFMMETWKKYTKKVCVLRIYFQIKIKDIKRMLYLGLDFDYLMDFRSGNI